MLSNVFCVAAVGERHQERWGASRGRWGGFGGAGCGHPQGGPWPVPRDRAGPGLLPPEFCRQDTSAALQGRQECRGRVHFHKHSLQHRKGEPLAQ